MTDATYSLVSLDTIEVKEQIREIFEDEENTLDDLAASIKARGVLQPVLLRLTTNGYVLIAGERRFRAAKRAGLEQIPAYIREMSDEEAEDAQMAENIHRKNLTQIEEAKKIQRDLDRLGSVEAVLEKHNKSRPWLSKMLSLLKLPDQTKRLVVENVSADLEVINTVKTIEKVDPVAAKDLVDNLKSARGKVNAREKVNSVKEKLKPSKKQTTKNKTTSKENKKEDEPIKVKEFGILDEASLEEREDPFTVDSLDKNSNLSHDDAILFLLSRITTVASEEAISDEDRVSIEKWLNPFYLAGLNGSDGKDISHSILEGLRDGSFSSEGKGAFALVAFLHGTKQDELDFMKILDCLRAQHGPV